MTEKILGYVLLALGVLTIIYSGFNVYQVFTRKSPPVQLFNFNGVNLDIGRILVENLQPEAAQMLKQNAARSAPTELLSPALINETSNVLAHFMLMGFIASIGARLAHIGVMLLRPIEVKLKAKEVVTENLT